MLLSLTPFTIFIRHIRESLMNNTRLSASVRELFEEHKAPMLLLEPVSCTVLFSNKSARVVLEDILEKGLSSLAKEKKKLHRHLQKCHVKRYHHFKLEIKNPIMPVVRIDASVVHMDDLEYLLLIFTNISRSALSKKPQKKSRKMESELNQMLAKRIENEVSLRYSRDELLLQQSKMAALGEMMDSIAHQWKQPLNALYLYTGMLRDNFSGTPVSPEEVREISLNMERQIEHLNATLNEFRGFYRHDKEKKEFFIRRALSGVLALMRDELMKHHIDCTVVETRDFPLFGYENEFKHILINLINNAKEAFAINETKMRTLAFTIGETPTHFFLTVQDNAGGIPKGMLQEIFKQYVTTKKEQGGTGIGLHLATVIAAKHHMTLRAENVQDGALFTLSIDKQKIKKPSC